TSVFLSASLILPSIAQAHSGRTNSSGCHNQTSNNTYHLGISYIWCRSTTGQAIYMDWPIQQIYNDLISK
ncbi:MAG: YHYH domain-containing protein, partial [Waterburya sp.]